MSDVAGTWRLAEDDIAFHPSEWLLDCGFAEENAAGFALGSLSDEEERRIAHHVSWCPSCARLLHEARKTASYLPFLSQQASPPERAKRGLFERIAGEQLAHPVAALGVDPTGTDLLAELLKNPPGLVIASDSAPDKHEATKRRFRWEMAAAPLAAVPLVFALAIVGGWALHTQSRLDHQAAQAQVLQSENAQLSAQVSKLSSALVSPQTSKFGLDSASSEQSGGLLVVDPKQGFATLTVWDLPQTSTYEVLVETENGEMQNAGDFAVDKEGTGQLQFNLPSPISDYQAVHVQRIASSTQTAPVKRQDVLWTDMSSNLGGQGDTEANATSH